MSKLKEVKLLGMPLWMFLILLVVTWGVGMTESIPGD